MMYFFIGLIIFYVVPLLIPPKVEIGPRKGPNASNGLFKIYLADDLGKNTLPILAQEVYEQFWKKLLYALYTIPILSLIHI